MDLYWLVEQGHGQIRALAVVGVDDTKREFRPLGEMPTREWPPITGSLRLLPVRTKPLTTDLEEALDILALRVDEVEEHSPIG